jgi:hypothetical protein
MSSTATIFGSFPSPAAQPATAPAAYPAVAAMFDSFGHDRAPRVEPASGPADAGSAVTASIFGSYADHLAALPAAAPGPVATAVSAFVVRIRQAFDRWTESNAQSRADALMWDIARSDPRIMAELKQARMRDDSETLGEPGTVFAVPVVPVLQAVPAMRQPSQRIAGQGWGRIIEDAHQHRFPSRHQHA